MIESAPLLGKRVLIPRGKDQAKSFSQLIEMYGGIPIEIPLLAFRPVLNSLRLKACLDALAAYDWIIFTSNVTVETFFSFFKLEEKDRLPKIAVIGKKTAEVLTNKGLHPEFVPTIYVAEAFVDEFSPYIHPGTRVLIPKGNLAREQIASSLSNLGASVDEVVIYETYMPNESRGKLGRMMMEKQLDILMFTSPSTVDNFMEVVQEYRLEGKVRDCIISCIGPVTEKKLREYGLPVHASPEEYTVKEMIKSTIAFYEQGAKGSI